MKKEISKIVIDTIKDFNESLAEDDKISTNLEASLYGGESNLDSLGLVSFDSWSRAKHRGRVGKLYHWQMKSNVSKLKSFLTPSLIT